MVAHLLKLKLTLLGNSLKRSPWFLIGQLVAVVYALGLLALLTAGMLTVRGISMEFWEITFVLGGAVVVMAWTVIPLLAFGLDSTLDPSRFVTFSVPRWRLLLGVGLSGLIGIPGVVTVLGLSIAALVWLPDLAALLAAVVAVVLGLITCVAGSRATTTALAPLLSSRRFREISGVLAMLPVLLIVPIFLQSERAARSGLDAIPGIVEVVSWTPFGAAWAVAVDVSQGSWGRAAGHGAIAIATVVAVILIWDHFFQRALVMPPSAGARDAKRQLGMGMFSPVVTTPARAIAARCLTYWIRDVRYIGSLTAVPILPVVLFLFSGGSPNVLLYVLSPAVAFLLGWAISADIAMDNTAFWMHVSSGVRGITDRAGRVLAVSVLSVPILIALLLGAAWYTGQWKDLPTAIGLTAGVFLSSVGLASVASARFVYAVPKPGDGPFSTPQGSAVANLIIQTVAWFILVGLIVPEVVLTVIAARSGADLAIWLTFVVGIGLGTIICWVGIRWGGRIFDARTPELMFELSKHG